MPTPDSTSWTVIRAAAAGSPAGREELARRYLGVVRAYLAARWRGAAVLGELADVRLWGLESGKLIGTPEMAANVSCCVAFSPDGRTLAASIKDSGGYARVGLWDLATWALQTTLHNPHPSTLPGMAYHAPVAYAAGGKRLALSQAGGGGGVGRGHAHGGAIPAHRGSGREKHRDGGQPRRPHPGRGRDAHDQWNEGGVPVEPGGGAFLRYLPCVARHADATGGRLAPRDGLVLAVAFTPDGRTLAVPLGGGRVGLWDVGTGQLRTTVPATADGTIIFSLACSPGSRQMPSDGRYVDLAARTFRHEVKLWDLGPPAVTVAFDRDREIPNPFRGSGFGIVRTGLTGPARITPRFSPSGEGLALNDQGSVRFWDLKTLREGVTVIPRKFPPSLLAMSSDGRTAAIAGRGRQGVRVVGARTPSGGVVLSGEAKKGVPRPAPKLDEFVTKTEGDHETVYLEVWDTAAGRMFRSLEFPAPIVRDEKRSRGGEALALRPDGRSVAVAYDDGAKDRPQASEVRVWDVNSGEQTATVRLPGATVGALAFEPRSGLLFITCGDGSLVAWDLTANAAVAELKADGRKLTPAGFSADGTRLITPDGVWDWRAGKPLDEPVPESVKNPTVSPDGRYEIVRHGADLHLIDRRREKPAGLEDPAARHARASYVRGVASAQVNRLPEAAAALRLATVLTPDDPATHEWLGFVLLRQGTLAESVDASRRAVTLDANRTASHRNLGNALARQGEWKGAAAAFGRASELDPKGHWTGFVLGALTAAREDPAAYQKYCQTMLERWGKTTDPVLAERTAKACLTAPGGVRDPGHLAPLIATAVAAGEKHAAYNWFLFAKGLHDYRAGRFEDALAACRRSRGLNPSDCLAALNHGVEALALHRLGKADDARGSLAAARKLFDEKGPPDGTGDWGDGWHDWLVCQLLLREAGALIER